MWEIDNQAFREACGILSIRKKVRVKYVEDLATDGLYISDPIHLILLNKRCLTDGKEFSSTLWHELGHAMQMERDFRNQAELFDRYIDSQCNDFFLDNYEPDLTNFIDYDEWLIAYNALPHEYEANKIAAKFSLSIPLFKQK